MSWSKRVGTNNRLLSSQNARPVRLICGPFVRQNLIRPLCTSKTCDLLVLSLGFVAAVQKYNINSTSLTIILFYDAIWCMYDKFYPSFNKTSAVIICSNHPNKFVSPLPGFSNENNGNCFLVASGKLSIHYSCLSLL